MPGKESTAGRHASGNSCGRAGQGSFVHVWMHRYECRQGGSSVPGTRMWRRTYAPDRARSCPLCWPGLHPGCPGRHGRCSLPLLCSCWLGLQAGSVGGRGAVRLRTWEHAEPAVENKGAEDAMRIRSTASSPDPHTLTPSMPPRLACAGDCCENVDAIAITAWVCPVHERIREGAFHDASARVALAAGGF